MDDKMKKYAELLGFPTHEPAWVTCKEFPKYEVMPYGLRIRRKSDKILIEHFEWNHVSMLALQGPTGRFHFIQYYEAWEGVS